jgi:FAD/FMN-containing dehydrogenase
MAVEEPDGTAVRFFFPWVASAALTPSALAWECFQGGSMKETEVQELRAKLRGELIAPGDADYDGARKVYNAMIDRRPALIARCADVADVVACVDFAREKKLLLAVPSGSGGGYINMMMDEGADNVKAAYRDNYARLAKVKRKYDPANLFRVNQNIRPADA